MSVSITTPAVGTDYDPPSVEAVEELKIFGLSDFGVKLQICFGSQKDGLPLKLEVISEHFPEDVYEFSLVDLLLDEVEWRGNDQEALDEVVDLIKLELARMASRARQA